MTLYCVEMPWSDYSTPDEYPDRFKWFSSFSEARAYARRAAKEWTEIGSWGETADQPVFAGGKEYRGAVVWKVTLPRLSPKKLVLWMSRTAALPGGEAVYWEEYK